jgi:hypothetical protein
MTSCKIDVKNLEVGHKIEPSSTIVKKEFQQPAFDKVEINVSANVKFMQTQEGDHRVVISAPDNYIELFDLSVNDNELDVDFVRKNVNIDVNNVDVIIYAPNLSKLENSGVASVEIDRLTAQDLELDNSGVGTMYISGLTVRKLEADCSGVGGIELSGTADEAELYCKGVGSIEATKLKARQVDAVVSGVGGIECFASEYINGEVSGVGSLKYGGKPTQKDFKRTGVGSIDEM